MFGEVPRGNLIFSGTAPNHTGQKSIFAIETTSDGNIFVTRGRQNLPLMWTGSDKKYSGGFRDQLKEVSRRFAEAVAYSDAGELESLHKSLTDILKKDVGPTRELLETMEKELSNYSRWFVRVTLSNDGREPAAVIPKAMLYVRTKGRNVKGDSTIERAMVHNCRIDLAAVQTRTMEWKGIQLPAGHSLVNDPIVVEGGKAVSVIFRSEKMFPEAHDDPAGLLEVYKVGDVPCRLILQRLGKVQNTTDYLQSRESVFQAAFDKGHFPTADSQWQ